MNKNKQTAVEWLALELYEKMQMKGDGRVFDDILNKALQMEREQIVNAVDGFPIESRNLEGEQYYTNTYGE